MNLPVCVLYPVRCQCRKCLTESTDILNNLSLGKHLYTTLCKKSKLKPCFDYVYFPMFIYFIVTLVWYLIFTENLSHTDYNGSVRGTVHDHFLMQNIIIMHIQCPYGVCIVYTLLNIGYAIYQRLECRSVWIQVLMQQNKNESATCQPSSLKLTYSSCLLHAVFWSLLLYSVKESYISHSQQKPFSMFFSFSFLTSIINILLRI